MSKNESTDSAINLKIGSELPRVEKFISKYFRTIIVFLLIVALLIFAFFTYQFNNNNKIKSLTALSGTECTDSKAVELVKPNIVKVINTYSGGESIGTGFFDSSGYVVTNSHVVAIKGNISLQFADNSKSNATLIANDKDKDIAIMKSDKKGLAVVWGNSLKLKPPDTLIAIGFPLDLPGEASVTKGSFSARRVDKGITYLQTDTPITHGNSGGPLINLCGEVVGINTAKIESTELNFAISSETAKATIQKLKTNPSISYEPTPSQTAKQSPSNTKKATQKPQCSGTSSSVLGNKAEMGKNITLYSFTTFYDSVRWSGDGQFTNNSIAVTSWSSTVLGDHTLTATSKNSLGQCSQSITIKVMPVKPPAKAIVFADNMSPPFYTNWVEIPDGYVELSVSYVMGIQPLSEYAVQYTNSPSEATETSGFIEQFRVSCNNQYSCPTRSFEPKGRFYRFYVNGNSSASVDISVWFTPWSY